jgi:hypothetical protein
MAQARDNTRAHRIKTRHEDDRDGRGGSLGSDRRRRTTCYNHVDAALDKLFG